MLQAMLGIGSTCQKLHSRLPLLLSPSTMHPVEPATVEPDLQYNGVDVTDGGARMSPKMAQAGSQG